MRLSFKITMLLLLAPCLLHARKHTGGEPKAAVAAERSVATTIAQPLNWFTATDQGDGTVQLQWSSKEENTGVRYILERSTDGVVYTSLGTFQAKGNRFMFLDDITGNDNNYYRIVARKGSAQQPVSQTLQVGAQKSASLKMSAEQDFSGEQLQLNVFAKNAATAVLKVMNSEGNMVYEEQLLLTDGYNRVFYPDYQQLETGSYYLTLQTDTGMSALKLER